VGRTFLSDQSPGESRGFFVVPRLLTASSFISWSESIMAVMQSRGREFPFRLAIPFALTAVLFYASILLYLLLYPLIYLYSRLLCVVSWYSLPTDTEILVVHDNSEHSSKWILRILPILTVRSTYLNWEENKDWRRWSLPVQLFDLFGPRPIPQFVMPHSLPAVMVFMKFHVPKLFTFGDHSREPETKLEELRSLIASDVSKQP